MEQRDAIEETLTRYVEQVLARWVSVHRGMPVRRGARCLRRIRGRSA